MAQSFTVPQSVRNNAKRGLELRKKHGRGGLTTAQAGAQGIGSGVARARDLIGGSVSLETVKRMSAFFDRHRKNKDTPPEKGNGMISWLLWGGDAGDRWAKGIINRMSTKSFSEWLETEKHGSHNQKRHGYRYGGNLTLDRARGMRRDGNWADYRKRADAKKKPKKGSGTGGGGASARPKKSDQRKKKLGRYAEMNDSQLQRELDKNMSVGRQLSASNRNYWGQGSQGASAAEIANIRERVQIEAALYGFSPGFPSLGIEPIEVTKKSTSVKKSFSEWLETTKPKGGSHGASIKNPRVYEALRRQGHSKTAAARISNAQVSKKAELTKSVAGRNLPAASFLVVGDPEKVTTWALPVRNADGSPDTRRMGAAWAALHGGYRGNKYEGQGKAQAIAKLRKMYADMGRTVPSVTQKAGSATNYNWAAGGGEKIGGGLSRADDGKFTSVGGGGAKPQSGASSAEMVAALSDVGMTKSDLTALENLQKGNADDVSPTAMKKLQKLGLVDEKGSVTTNGKAMSRAIKNRDAEAIRALKPAKPGKGGGGGKAPKPSKGEIEAQNIKAVQAKIEGRVPSSASSALVGFSKNGEISPGQAEQLKKLGLMREVDGGYLATPEGKLLLSALKGGDTAKANEAILRGRERVKKNAERQNKPKPTTRPAKKELHGRVWVVTDKEGKHRWLSISSNSYQDREGEIVSQKALEKAVERGDMGDLRWWHEGGAVIGSTDFQMIHGRMLIESGTFKSEKIGAAFAKLKDMGVSVGFLHPPDQPNRDGVYSDIKIFERSVLPSRKAANALTTFGVM